VPASEGGARIRRKSLSQPDDERLFSRGRGLFVDIGTLIVGRAVLEPGWRWSVDMRPAVGTPSCQVHHLHLLLQGRFAVRLDSGEAQEFEADDVMDIPPGHDAWVVGEEPVVLVDIAGNVADFGLPVSRSRAVATMLMTDIVASTETAARLGDAVWRQRLDEHNRVVRHHLERYRGREINTTGDGFLATFESAGAALLAALAIRDAAADIGLPIRAGVHTGEIEVVGDDVRGIAVHATARVMAEAGASEVLTTIVTRSLVTGVACRFEDRGERMLKGLDQPLNVFAVEHAA
jgi:class 3 adenylate cyclase